MIRRMILESFQVEKCVEEHMDSTDYLLKVMKYEGPKTSGTQVGLGAHTDQDVVTILYQNEVNGLEVQCSSGEWIGANPSKDSFIVTIGESLHVIIIPCFFFVIIDELNELVGLVVNGAGMVKWAIEGYLSSSDDERRQAKVLAWTVYSPKTRLHDKGTRRASG